MFLLKPGGYSVFKKSLFSVGTALILLLGAGFIFTSPQNLSWRSLNNDTNSPIARHENGYVEANGKFYLVGGRGTHSIQVYNPADSSWDFKAEPPDNISLHHFQAVSIGDTLYIVGAYNGDFPDETAVKDIYKYDVPSDTWVIGSEIPASRRRAAAGVVAHNGKIYIVCGSTGGHGAFSARTNQFDEYDPLTDTWTTLPNAPNARDHVHVAVINNKLYVAGGRNGELPDTVNEVDVYDFGSGQWSTLSAQSNIPIPRSGAATVAVGRYLVVIGGESNQQVAAHDEVHALDTETQTWVTLESMNVGRHGTQAVYFDEQIYIVAGAGERGGSPELIAHEVFDTMGETTLPVELDPEIITIVDGNNVLLQWRTLSETNNAGFEVQHRVGESFTRVGFVNGYGTSTSSQNYSFTVSGLSPGHQVFRLKQIDFDGAFEYSPEITAFISLENGYHMGAIYPNPTNPQARFELSVAQEQQVQVNVYDMLGRRIANLHSGVLLPNTAHSFSLESDQWAGGKYLVKVEGEYFMTSKVFTVLK